MENSKKHLNPFSAKAAHLTPRRCAAKHPIFYCATLEDAFSLANIPYPQCTFTSKKIVRFSTNEKRGDTAGWCHMFADNLGAAFGDWRQGTTFIWQKRNNGSFEANPLEISYARAKATVERRQMEHEQHEAAAKTAISILSKSLPATVHKYLTNKCVKAYSVRVAFWRQGFRDPVTGDRMLVREQALIIPMYDAEGKLWSVAAIAPDGRKDFLWGGKKKGCFHRIGEVGNTVCIAEGYATAATIHEATGYAVFVAFDAGNMVVVAESVRRAYPVTRIIVCADNDHHTPGNPGLTKGREAARAIGGLVAAPSFDRDAM